MRPATSDGSARSTRTLSWSRRRCSSWPTGWVATTAATWRARSSSRSSASSPRPATTSEHGPEAVAETLRSCQARIAAYDDAQRAGGATDFAAGTTAVVALLIEQGDGPEVAAGQPGRLADLPLQRRRPRAGQRRPQRRPGAPRRRHHHGGGRRGAPRAAHHHPGARWAGERRGRLLRAAALACRAADALLRRGQRDDRRTPSSPTSWPPRPTRATPPTRSSRPPWRPAGVTTRRRWSSMWWDWSRI